MKRILSLFTLLLLFSTAFVEGKGASATRTEADSVRSDTLSPLWLFTEGIKYNTIHGDTTRARHYFRRTIQADSTFAPAYFQLFLYDMYSTPEEGVGLARRAWRIDTLNSWYLRSYGRSLILANRYKEALAAYERLVRIEQDDPDTYRILAALYEQDNNPYIALSTLDSAELHCGRIPYLSMIKRRLLIATNQIDKAIAEQEALVAGDPYTRQYHIDLGSLYGLAGRDSMAVAEFEHALKMDSTKSDAYLALASLYNDRQDYKPFLKTFKRMFGIREIPADEKIAHIERLTADLRFYGSHYLEIRDLMNTLAIMYPKDKRVVDLYAGHLIAAGEVETALNLYKAHLDDQPVQKDYYLSVIDIEVYQKRIDSAELYMRRAMRLFPKDPDLNLVCGNVKFQAGDYDEALKIYRRTLNYAATDSVRSAVWCIMGDTYHRMASERRTDGTLDRKIMKQCYKAYNRSLEYDPDNIVVLNNYAYFLSVEGIELDRALALATRVVAAEPDNATYLDTYAWILYKMGRYPEAKTAMRQAIAMDRQMSADLMVHYGDILFKLKEYFLAENYWRKALERDFDAAQIESRMQELKNEKEKAHE